MEFHEKLQELRKQKGLTQEALAQSLYVSRTAISKWESGRGYPNIDSLKLIAKFFSVTIDELLSCEEVLSAAEETLKQKESHFRNLIFGLLDCSIAMFLFLPLFGQKSAGIIHAVSLLSLTETEPYLRIAYWAIVIGMIGSGILTLILQNCQKAVWNTLKHKTSLLLNIIGALLFIASSQPYAAAFLFVSLIIKVFMIVKKQ